MKFGQYLAVSKDMDKSIVSPFFLTHGVWRCSKMFTDVDKVIHVNEKSSLMVVDFMCFYCRQYYYC